jgi:hypothetical protein
MVMAIIGLFSMVICAPPFAENTLLACLLAFYFYTNEPFAKYI